MLHYIYKSGQCHPCLTYIFNFWYSGTLDLRVERPSARMSEIKNGWAPECPNVRN